MADDLVVHLARFAGALRDHGVAAGIGDEIDATNALTLIDLFDRDEVRRAFLVAFKIRPRDRAAFDATFDAFWSVSRAGAPADAAGSGPRRSLPRSGADERPAMCPWLPAGIMTTAGRPTAGIRATRLMRYSGGSPSRSVRTGISQRWSACSARLTPRWAARRSRR